MDKKVNKILILSIFPEKSSLGVYARHLKKYFDQKEDCQVEFVDLYSKSSLKRLLRIIFYKNEKEFDYGFIQEPILAKTLANSKVKNKVFIIHDLLALTFSTSWKRPAWSIIFKYSLNLDKLIFISKFAKEEFIDFYHKYQIPQNEVIHGGIDEIFFEPSKKRQKKYDFIHIAGGYERKNFKFILQILKHFHIAGGYERKNFKFILQILKHFKDKKLLKIGRISRQNAAFIKENNLKVSVVERCSEEDKKQYLEESKVLLFPSTYEGFGLPPVEAAASNCYVLSANNTGLLESNLEENLLPLEKNVWIDRINTIFSEEDEEILKKQKEFAQSFNIERFLSEVERFVFEE